MNICNLPFNRLIGLEMAEHGSDLMVGLPDGPQYLNHLGTVHASALLAVAEAGSGEFLYRNFRHIENLVPVLRKFDAKFRKPASGRITARCLLATDVVDKWLSELESRGRLLAAIPVEVLDATDAVVLSATAEWFVSRVS
jgi:hypothetical protein